MLINLKNMISARFKNIGRSLVGSHKNKIITQKNYDR